MPWERAQENYLDASRATAESAAAALGERKIAVTVLAAPLRPLNNVTGAAIAIELAPPSGAQSTPEVLGSPAYQQQMAVALAAALAATRKVEAP